jgi:hypothetical protein
MSLINTPEICECTADDYECDIGFYRNKYGGCYLASGKEIDFTPPGECDKYYTVKKGYRKVANDVCEGGMIHQDYSLPCPGESRRMFMMIAAITAIFFLIILIVKCDVMKLLYR